MSDDALINYCLNAAKQLKDSPLGSERWTDGKTFLAVAKRLQVVAVAPDEEIAELVAEVRLRLSEDEIVEVDCIRQIVIALEREHVARKLAERRLTTLQTNLQPIKARILAEHGIITGYEEVLIDLIEEATGGRK